MLRPTFCGLALLFSAACATVKPGEAGPAFPPGQHPAVTHADTGPDVEAVVTAFYGTSFDPARLAAQLGAALARHPDNPDLHEVATELALLQGDADLNELHSLRAALDPGNAMPTLFLRNADPNHDLPIEVARVLAKDSPDPEVRAVARRLLLTSAVLRDDPREARRQFDALGFLDQWIIAGAFDNDEGKGFLTRYPPEQSPTPFDLTASMPGVLVPVHWRRVPQVDPQGLIPLEALTWPDRNAVVYAATFLRVPTPQDAVLWLTSHAPLRVFVDGQLALSRATQSPGHVDNLAVKMHLEAGPHTLLIKSANKSTDWHLSARLTTPAGAPITGLVQSSEPGPRVSPSPSLVASLEELPTLRGLRPGLSEAREHLLGARAALKAGDPKAAVIEAAAFADLSPNNPLALYVLAISSQANDEQGKALNLLNEGVKRFGEALPRFHLERSRIYAEKGLNEKAQADAEAFLKLRPHDFAGELQLAWVEGRRSFQVERCRTLEETVADHPRQVQSLDELASCRIDDGHLAAARALLEQARQLAPGEYDTLRARFDLARHTFDQATATALAQELRDRHPTWPSLWIDSGEMAERAERPADARAFYLAANALSPDAPGPLSHLAALAYRGGNQAEALRLWNDAAVREPANSLLAERIEHLQPTRLGFIEKFIPSDDDIDAAVASGRKLIPLDGSHVVLLLDDEVTEVHTDGSSTRVVTTVERAVNDQGRDGLIQASVPTLGHLKMLKAYALTKGGERQEASSVRNGAIRFRNLTVGSTVVLQYVHYSPAAHFLPNEFTADWRFESVAREHVQSRWTLVLPKSRSLHVQVTGDVKHTETTENDLAIHRFEARNVPPFIEEPSSPPIHDLLRHVGVSTVPSWEDYAQWERALLTDAFQESTDLGTLARKLTAGTKTPREKLDHLTAYVAQEIRYQQDYENTIAGVRPHSSRQILERGYGDCKDKAVLLISLAREVGLKMDFVVLRTKPAGEVDRELPNQQFNHAIVYVPKQEGIADPLFVDATTDGLDVGSLRADDQGAWTLVLDPLQNKGFEFIQIPYRPAAEQYEQHQIAIQVGDDGKVESKDRLVLRGNDGSMIRRVLRNPAYARKLDEQLAAYLFPASTLAAAEAGDPDDVWHPISLSIAVDDSNALEITGLTRRLRLPGLQGLDRLATLTTRKSPLELGVPEINSMHLSIQLPKGSEVLELPQDFEETPKCLAIRRKSKVSGDTIDMTLELTRTCAQVSTADYPTFRADLLKVANRLQEQLAFGPSRGKPAKTHKAR